MKLNLAPLKTLLGAHKVDLVEPARTSWQDDFINRIVPSRARDDKFVLLSQQAALRSVADRLVLFQSTHEVLAQRLHELVHKTSSVSARPYQAASQLGWGTRQQMRRFVARNRVSGHGHVSETKRLEQYAGCVHGPAPVPFFQTLKKRHLIHMLARLNAKQPIPHIQPIEYYKNVLSPFGLPCFSTSSRSLTRWLKEESLAHKVGEVLHMQDMRVVALTIMAHTQPVSATEIHTIIHDLLRIQLVRPAQLFLQVLTYSKMSVLPSSYALAVELAIRSGDKAAFWALARSLEARLGLVKHNQVSYGLAERFAGSDMAKSFTALLKGYVKFRLHHRAESVLQRTVERGLKIRVPTLCALLVVARIQRNKRIFRAVVDLTSTALWACDICITPQFARALRLTCRRLRGFLAREVEGMLAS